MSTTITLGRLTSLSTRTLTLILERQRLSIISTSSNVSATNPNEDKIRQNLETLRSGIEEYEQTDNAGVKELRDQFERMRDMFGDENIPPLQPPKPPTPDYVPYRDEPIPSPSPATPGDLEAQYGGGGSYSDSEVFQNQQMMMDEQDTRLDTLSDSINRQRDISLQINGELDHHTGLLEQLDQDLDRTEGRMSGARRQLQRFSNGAKGNEGTILIGLLIAVLLILIVIFKT